MSTTKLNPFNITKAVDFTDEDINRYWVDISSHGFLYMLKPHSLMPMLILGGKGSGKTHIMRHCSYSVRSKLFTDSVLDVQKDGFLGIYFRCSGLNAKRFTGRGVSPDIWETVFPYYLDIWISQLLLKTVVEVFLGSKELEENEEKICADICNVFDEGALFECDSVVSLLSLLRDLQREIDIPVNNLMNNPELRIPIRASIGRLLFEIPIILARHLPSFNEIKFLYLIDEFENLTEPHQKYVNSIVREREGPCTFRVGSRLYGIKTFSTYSADEINKEGAEFELLQLDAQLRLMHYNSFAQKLCFNRLQRSGYMSKDQKLSPDTFKKIEGFFMRHQKDVFASEETSFILKRFKGQERRYFTTLREKLTKGMQDKCAVGISSVDDIEEVIGNLSVEEKPLLEKVNIYLFFASWYKGKENLLESSREIKRECVELLNSTSKGKSRQEKKLEHFKDDLLAQLRRQYKVKQHFYGLSSFIEMSTGLPRHFLMILKHIFDWATFNEEAPFVSSNKISFKAQENGVLDASEWFYHDSRAVGDSGQLIINAIDRLSLFFKEYRYSDKPSECSLVTFSVDLSGVTEQTRKIIDLAEKWSLLIRIPGGQHDKNSMRIDDKYQLNPMLAPRWDLSIARRGSISFRVDEADVIFDEGLSDGFKAMKKNRIDRMTAPYFGKGSSKQRSLL